MRKYDRQNFYHLLQVQPDASVEVIKASYRTIMGKLKQHPDLGGSTAEACFINEAYEILTDSKKRAQYDLTILRDVPYLRPAGGKEKTTFYGYPIQGERPRREAPNAQRVTLNNGKVIKEQRSAPRIPQQGPIIYFPASHIQGFQGEIIDFSPEGFRFRCTRQVKIGEIIHIQTSLFQAKVQVKNCRQEETSSHYFCGAVFLSVEFMKNQGLYVSLTA